MKRFVLLGVLAAAIRVRGLGENSCKSIDAWTNDVNGKEIKLIEGGLITKDFDSRITVQDKLYLLDENSHVQSIFLTSKVPLQEKPLVVSSNEKLSLTEDHSLEGMNYFSDTLKIRISLSYTCAVDVD